VSAYEVNFDGLVGPTHNFAGLSFGNIASSKHASQQSNPKAAALQGLEKMKALLDMGLKQAVLPPQERPHILTLRRLGFTGSSDAQLLRSAWKEAPELVAGCSSASSMWVANAATVSPSADTADGRTHFTPANLSSMFHRSIEHETTGRVLERIFSDPERFVHHPALPAISRLGDEGAANHTRLCSGYEKPGVELFVYGGYGWRNDRPGPTKYPARQTLEASQAVARNHQLSAANTVFAQQNPVVIDQGVFHNDVIAVGNGNTLFYHQLTFHNPNKVLRELKAKFEPSELCLIEVPDTEVSVVEAVDSYLFNSQLINTVSGEGAAQTRGMSLIAPIECQENSRIRNYLDRLISGPSPVNNVHFFDLRQSMSNGGGPACLRLRVVLDDDDIQSIDSRPFMDDALYKQLKHWVEEYYRDRLSINDLTDPDLLDESRSALDALTEILSLGSVYEFQRSG